MAIEMVVYLSGKLCIWRCVTNIKSILPGKCILLFFFKTISYILKYILKRSRHRNAHTRMCSERGFL